MNSDEVIQSAIQYFQTGNLRQAEFICEKILKNQPNNVIALNLLGVIYYQFRDFNSSIECIQKAIQIDPYNPESYYNLGNAFKERGQFNEAIVQYKKALQFDSSFAAAYCNLGATFQDQGQFNEAIFSYKKALKIDPNLADAYYNIGVIFQTRREYDEAEVNYKKSLQINPASADAYYNLGLIFQKRGQINEATTYYEKVLQNNPNFTEAYNNLGILSQKRSQLDKAIAYFQKAIMLNPYNSSAYNNIGNVLDEKNQTDEAVNYYKKAIEVNPDFADAYYNMGNALRHQGKNQEALNAYDMALTKKPNYVAAKWAFCTSQLSIIYADFSSIQIFRNNYLDELNKLRHTIKLDTPEDIEAAADAIGKQLPFFLAYQGFNDRKLQQLYGDLVCRIMALKYPSFVNANKPIMPPHSKRRRIRVGIISGFFCIHSNWKIPIKGWIENLGRTRFDLYAYYTRKKKDRVTSLANQYFKRFVCDVFNFEELCKIIKEDKLHVLIFPEIGMDPVTVRLAALKLAPVQCSSWGHPETSGFPTIDYFLSSELMEPPSAEDHYTEQLVRLPNLSIYYTPLNVTPVKASRETFGLRSKSIVYLCCQSLFKYLPQYDDIYPRIAERINNCQFVFISYPKSNLITEHFKIRLTKTFKEFGLDPNEYIVFLPPLDSGHYKAINCLADIYLDSIGWSGSNTTLEAIECDLPIVTFPGELMRSRHSYAILKMMGMTDTIGMTVDQYISIAVKLGQNQKWRHHVSHKIAGNKHRLYHDKLCIDAMEDFITKIVEEKSIGVSTT